jgi:hypothetical protein
LDLSHSLMLPKKSHSKVLSTHLKYSYCFILFHNDQRSYEARPLIIVVRIEN